MRIEVIECPNGYTALRRLVCIEGAEVAHRPAGVVSLPCQDTQPVDTHPERQTLLDECVLNGKRRCSRRSFAQEAEHGTSHLSVGAGGPSCRAASDKSSRCWGIAS